MADDWVHLRLRLESFDEDAIANRVARADLSTLGLATLADLGDSDAERRLLYELNRECSLDIPGRGPFYSFDEYVAERINVPSFDSRTVVVALDGNVWVGMTAASDHRAARGYMFDEMTGVRAAYRGRGLSLALKLANIRFMRSIGVTEVRTMHHRANTTAIAMNRRLGYQPL